jgi:hypothetical protein
MVLPSLFAVTHNLFLAVFNEPEMKADVVAFGVTKLSVTVSLTKSMSRIPPSLPLGGIPGKPRIFPLAYLVTKTRRQASWPGRLSRV